MGLHWSLWSLFTSPGVGSLSISPTKFHPLLFAWVLTTAWANTCGVLVMMEGSQGEGEGFVPQQNPSCFLAGVHQAGWREQSCGVQRRGAHQGRRQGGVQECPGQWPVRPQLAQNCPQHPGQGCLPLHRLQAGAGAAHRREGEYWHSRKDCDWQTPVWQCPYWCKYCTCWLELGKSSALGLQPVNEWGFGGYVVSDPFLEAASLKCYQCYIAKTDWLAPYDVQDLLYCYVRLYLHNRD